MSNKYTQTQKKDKHGNITYTRTYKGYKPVNYTTSSEGEGIYSDHLGRSRVQDQDSLATVYHYGPEEAKRKFGDKSKKIKKNQTPTSDPWGKDIVERMIPVYGTYKEAQDLYNNPSWSQAGWTALSALGDLSMLIPLIGPELKAGITAARVANGIGKAAKVTKAKRVVPIIQDANKARQIQHAKTMEDITWPALYSVMVRPSAVTLSLPFRIEQLQENDSIKNDNDSIKNNENRVVKNENPTDNPWGIKQVSTQDGEIITSIPRVIESEPYIESKANEEYWNRINENEMHRAEARGAWHRAWNNGIPSIPEMAKAAYHYWMGNPSLGGNSESLVEPLTGIAPTPGMGKIKNVKDAEEYFLKLYGRHPKYAGDAIHEANKYNIRLYRENAKKLYKMLSPEEKKAFDIYLKNGNSSLEEITGKEYEELQRLLKNQHIQSELDERIIFDRSVNRTKFSR